MSKTTPEPWWFCEDRDGLYVVGAGDVEITKPISRADAQLIAAAPKMRALLLEVSEARARQSKGFDAEDWYARVREVIAIETGQSEPEPRFGIQLAYEVLAAGFDGGSDATDDRVFWVTAHSCADVELAIHGTGAEVSGQIDTGDLDSDFSLPQDAYGLRAALLAFKDKP